MAENGENKKEISNSDLRKARQAKKDEFYTQLDVIQEELKNYREKFKGKTVFCNCDDPDWSNFWRYFYDNFTFLGLKKLIATHYHPTESTYKLEHDKESGTKKTPLKENGDFRSQECIELLQEADIVCTNPPFSLFKKYVSQLIEYNKNFLIIGNINALTYRETCSLVKDNKTWLGCSIKSGDREFGVPDSYPITAAGFRIDEKGKKYIRIKGVRWFTNLDYEQRHQDIILFQKYNPDDYPTYDNYNAIEVSKVKNIPDEYDGEMGVPITFLDKFNPEQFEILHSQYSIETTDGEFELKVNGKKLYFRFIIKCKP